MIVCYRITIITLSVDIHIYAIKHAKSLVLTEAN